MVIFVDFILFLFIKLMTSELKQFNYICFVFFFFLLIYDFIVFARPFLSFFYNQFIYINNNNNVVIIIIIIIIISSSSTTSIIVEQTNVSTTSKLKKKKQIQLLLATQIHSFVFYFICIAQSLNSYLALKMFSIVFVFCHFIDK